VFHVASRMRFFFYTLPAHPVLHPLSLHDALPISSAAAAGTAKPTAAATTEAASSAEAARPVGRIPVGSRRRRRTVPVPGTAPERSEEHTSELQSRFDLVCRLLLEKKKKISYIKRL